MGSVADHGAMKAYSEDPTKEGSRGRKPARHLSQVRGRPPFRHQPLVDQALHQTRRPRRASYPQEGRRERPRSGRGHEEATGGGPTHQALSHYRTEAPLAGELRRQEHKRAHLKEAPKAYGLQPKKRTVGAVERDEWQRAAWRVTVAQTLDARSLVFVDEMGTNTFRFLLCMGGPRRDGGPTARYLAIAARTPPCLPA